MKKLIFLVSLLFCFNLTPAFAENSEEVKLAQDIAQKQKK